LNDVRKQLDPVLVYHICQIRGIKYEMPRSTNHLHYGCDACGISPIVSSSPYIWYTCNECNVNYYDICLSCYENNEHLHDPTHTFKKNKEHNYCR